MLECDKIAILKSIAAERFLVIFQLLIVENDDDFARCVKVKMKYYFVLLL